MHKVIFKIYWYFIKNIICCNNKEINDFINEDIIRRYILGILSINDSGAIAFLDSSVIKWNFKNLVFENYMFSYCDLQYAEFTHSSFDQCIFVYSNLSNANLYGIKLNSYLQFVNCNMNGIQLKNLQLTLRNEGKNKGKNNKKGTQNNALELKGVSLDNAQFSDMDLRTINFDTITSMHEAKLKNIKLNLKQFLYLAKFKIRYRSIEIFISPEDFTIDENKEIIKWGKRIKDEKQRQEQTYNIKIQEPKIHIKEGAINYLMDIIVKKLKKNGVQQSVIDSLKLQFDENDIYHSYFIYS